MLETCLGKYAGAGMQFAPMAVADDGSFEVLLIENVKIWRLLSSLLYLYNGRINQHPAVRHCQAVSVVIDCETKQNFHCDGELIGRLPVKIDLLPRALRVIGPGTPR